MMEEWLPSPDQLAAIQEVMAREPGPEPDVPEPDATTKVITPNIPAAAPAAAPPQPQPKKRPTLYSPERRGFLRATREHGIGDELAQMKREATGTPFYDEPKPVAVKPALRSLSEAREMIERLQAKSKAGR